MKNIHLLSTEKPSRLFNCFGKLEIGDYTTIRENLQVTNQHIYITSDEEIKDGDWLIVNDEDVMQMKSSYDNDMSGEDIWVGDSLNGYATYKDNCKKIILTTDQNLINDGVQAIDDEFLEWFVKNPSCEEVKIKRDFADEGIKGITYYGKYFLIIPKEEPKQFVECKCTNSLQAENCIRNCGHGQEPCDNCGNEICCCILRKQETLEEAIKREYETRKFNSDFPFDPQSFKLGAKWAQERMYSEEEVKKIAFDFYYDISHKIGVPENLISENATNVDAWFKQFKKK